MRKILFYLSIIFLGILPLYGEPLDISLWIDKGNGAVYRQNESIEVYFKSNKDCYITIYAIDTEGYIQLLFPLSKFSNNFIKSGKTYSVPDDWDYPDFKAHGPGGMIYIQAIATTAPQNLPDWPEYYKNIRDNDYRIVGDPYSEIDNLNNMISRIEPMPEYYDSKSVYLYVNDNIRYNNNERQCYYNIHFGHYIDFYPYYDFIIFDRWYYPPRFIYWDWYEPYWGWYEPYYIYNNYYFYYPNRWNINNIYIYNYNGKRYKNSYSNIIIRSKSKNILSFNKRYKTNFTKKINSKYYKPNYKSYKSKNIKYVNKNQNINKKSNSYKIPKYKKSITISPKSQKVKPYIPNIYEKPKNNSFKINKNNLSSSIKTKSKNSKFTNFISNVFKSATKSYIKNTTKRYSSKYKTTSKIIKKISSSYNKKSYSKPSSSYKKSTTTKTRSKKSSNKIIIKKKH